MLQNLKDITPTLAGATVFSTLDATSGFWQVPIAESSMLLTTFITPLGRYCFVRIPTEINFGPRGVPDASVQVDRFTEGF